MQKIKVIPLSLLMFAMVAASSLQAADRMRSGQWEVTTTAEGKTATNTHCMTPEQAKSANGSPEEIRASAEKGAASLHCTLQDFKLEKNTISYGYSCPGRSTQTKTTFDGDTYVTTHTQKIGSEVHTSEFKGRRVGDCPAQ